MFLFILIIHDHPSSIIIHILIVLKCEVHWIIESLDGPLLLSITSVLLWIKNSIISMTVGNDVVLLVSIYTFWFICGKGEISMQCLCIHGAWVHAISLIQVNWYHAGIDLCGLRLMAVSQESCILVAAVMHSYIVKPSIQNSLPQPAHQLVMYVFFVTEQSFAYSLQRTVTGETRHVCCKCGIVRQCKVHLLKQSSDIGKPEVFPCT